MGRMPSATKEVIDTVSLLAGSSGLVDFWFWFVCLLGFLFCFGFVVVFGWLVFLFNLFKCYYKYFEFHDVT